MCKILVTGGAGNIGSALVKKLLQNQQNFIVVADNLSTGLKNKLPPPSPKWKFINCDVNKYKGISELMTSNNFDYVFHFAAIVGVSRTQENPIKVLEDIDGIKYILELSKNTGVKRVFFSSSSEVYGEPVELPQHEHTTPLNSRVPYAIVKNVGEAYLKSYKQEYDLDYTIFRFFNTYGVNQSPDFVVTRFIRAALNNQDITLYGDGSQTRTFCYVDDNIDACVKILYKNKMINDIINIGGDVVIKIIDLAKMIISLTNSSSKIINLPPLIDGDMTRRQPDNTKMLAILGRDLLSIEEGIKLMLADENFVNSCVE
ncbi:MAG: NAD-dependent epimerase/dehydratase family protein [Flavobacteriales bacterium]|jgi:nucleoside-diphosphate-sugar epimerase|nr:NAD-dependent epimerase/dehydratase family protein [Flavobacteriales bacterium]MBT6744967.1 NAD-dependent epimerase/dehydratase family protein [Flavobacteriales bacterium]